MVVPKNDPLTWNIFVMDFFLEDLRMFEIARNVIAKNFNRYAVIIVMMNFLRNFSISKTFPSRFPGIFANSFQRKIIPVYSTSY